MRVEGNLWKASGSDHVCVLRTWSDSVSKKGQGGLAFFLRGSVHNIAVFFFEVRELWACVNFEVRELRGANPWGSS